MTILVDAAIWPWRGRHWAHLVSDVSYDELHEFAVSIGVRRLGFQGDHYDIESDTRVIALEQGAVDTDSRQIVRRLRASGLRIAPGQKPPSWQWMTKRMTVDDDASLRAAVLPDVFGPTTHQFVNALSTDLMRVGAIEAALLSRPEEAALILAVSGPSQALRLEVSEVLARNAAPDGVSIYVSGYGDIVVEVLEALVEVLEAGEPSPPQDRLETQATASSHR
ncbi:MAG: DUF4031 domain-containing protein [Actinobacteria bacterium]|nr:DUF4031 domain-containing protein [Actinomycetota bacterium]